MNPVQLSPPQNSIQSCSTECKKAFKLNV